MIDQIIDVDKIEIQNHADKENNHATLRKYPVRILIMCSILLFGELVWIFIISPCMPLSSVNITGTEINNALILEKAGITPRTSYFSFNEKKTREALLSIPVIENAEIIKKFPDTVIINLRERVAVALSLVPLDERIMPVIFDKAGVVFQIGDEGGIAINNNLPIISGLVFERVKVGLHLPDFVIPLLYDIKELEDNTPELLNAISEIRINKKTNDSFDVTVYPSSNSVRIRIGAELNAEKISYALLLLDVLKERNINVDEVDFRSGTASYKTKN
ncbi:MAG: FtsQ-type POTRA domain-containing protein [Spirochaetaceae bacterium]|nr:FtsQ-type POTRA domain-containing protein [Spirochaetaceae bacterium]